MSHKHKAANLSASVSLAEINGTIAMPPKDAGFWRSLLRFSGPGALVAVGYMDPGNWITSIGGGSDFGYLLLSVILVSSLIAMLLQYMSAKLGIVTGMDLAQATRRHTSRKLGIVLWLIAELGIMATEVAEVIGAAIALNLLFGIPLIVGVILTVADVMILLVLLRFGFRKIEAIVATLILTIVVVFTYEVWLAGPDIPSMFEGFLPSKDILRPAQLTMALGIVGATVMPHNLYLHSSIVQSRKVDRKDSDEVARALRFTIWDSNIQLGAAFIVNCLLLLLGAALFYGQDAELGTFSAIYDALKNPSITGSIASPVLSTLFAVALLASGQNSTITGTLSGQIVMEGFLRITLPLWVTRLVTRLIAIIPVVLVVIIFGSNELVLDNLLIYSQVFLCVALPFCMIPLVLFTSSKRIMGERFKNPIWIAALGWISAIVLTILNIQLIIHTVSSLFS